MDRAIGDRRKVERLPLIQSALAAREGQQGLDEALLLDARREHAALRRAERLDRGVGIREIDLEERALACEGSAELVRSVRHELSLCGARVGLLALALVALVATACSGLPGGAATASATPSASASSDALAFSNCMRSHGLTSFPDMDPSKGMLFTKQSGMDPSSPQFQSAMAACRSLLPGGGATSGQTGQSDMLKFAQCMRVHGVSSFPDPDPNSSAVRMPHGIDPNSASFKAAQSACQSALPSNGPRGTP